VLFFQLDFNKLLKMVMYKYTTHRRILMVTRVCVCVCVCVWKTSLCNV